MRLLILGPLDGHISTAGKIALARGATVAHVDDIEHGLAALRAGQGADLLMMDVKLDIARLIESLKQERIIVPIVACGIGTDAERRGARDQGRAPRNTFRCRPMPS